MDPLTTLKEPMSGTLYNILVQQDGPLLCIGDFNQILSNSDRLGNPANAISSAPSFQQFLFNLGLSELDSTGPHYTWTNNRFGSSCTFERLDRAFYNGAWSSLSLATSVTNLPIHGSDHAPILLFTNKGGIHRKRLFKLEKFWSHHEGCKSIIQASWQENFVGSPMFVVVNRLRSVRHNLLRWSREGIGVLANRISSTHSLLTDIQSALDSNKDFAQEAIVRNQLENLLAQEEMLWAQRAKSKFIALGNKNTAYFHRISKIRRQRTNIKGIEDVQGTWTDIEEEVQNIFSDHFKNIYSEPNSTINLEDLGWLATF